MATPIDVIMLKCRKKFSDDKSAKSEIVRYLPHTHTDKKILAPCQIVATARIAPKICQGQPQTFGSQCSRFHPNRFTLGGVIADRVKAVLWAHWVNPCRWKVTRWKGNSLLSHRSNEVAQLSSLFCQSEEFLINMYGIFTHAGIAAVMGRTYSRVYLCVSVCLSEL